MLGPSGSRTRPSVNHGKSLRSRHALPRVGSDITIQRVGRQRKAIQTGTVEVKESDGETGGADSAQRGHNVPTAPDSKLAFR